MAKSFLAGQGVNNGGKKSGKNHSSGPPWKKIGIVAGVIALAFVLGVGAFLLQNSTNQPADKDNNKGSSASPEDAKPEGALEESVALSLQGDYGAAQQRIDEELKNVDNDEHAQDLVIQQSFNAYNEEKYQESLQYAQKAIEINDNKQANLAAAYAAEAAGELGMAEKYYRTALEKIDKNAPRAEEQAQDLREAIERVSR